MLSQTENADAESVIPRLCDGCQSYLSDEVSLKLSGSEKSIKSSYVTDEVNCTLSGSCLCKVSDEVNCVLSGSKLSHVSDEVNCELSGSELSVPESSPDEVVGVSN